MHEWRARIGREDGYVLGAGFLVDATRLITCAHVVEGVTEVHVTLPGVRDALPGTVAWRGGWREQGDAGDVAVVELADAVDVTPCGFAPGAVALGRAGRAASYELRALGFPDGHEAHGTYATLRTSDDRTLGAEWQEVDVEEAHLRRLDEGFSGSAAYDPATGRVVGMVTDAVLDGEQAGYIGRIMPLRTIRRHWEDLDDLLDLDWLPNPQPRRELRALLAGVEPVVALELVVRRAFPAFRRPLPPFASVWAAVRYVGENMSGENRLLRLLTALRSGVPDGSWARVEQWLRRWEPGYEAPGAPGAADAGSGPVGSVMVRLEPLTRGASLDLTVCAVVDGVPVSRKERQRIRRDQVRAKVEAALAEQVGQVNDSDWMVEFVVPDGLMNQPFEEWEIREPGAPRPRPLRTVPVVVRHVERLKPLWATRLTRRRWQTVRARGETRPEGFDCTLPYTYQEFYDLLEADDDLCALAYAATPGPDWLSAALDTGVPIMLWRRYDCGGGAHDACAADKFLDALVGVLHALDPDRLPVEIMRLRKEARSPSRGHADHCGHRLTLFWDDPERDPDPPLAMRGA
ncbi:trypsin-like peptidase domain-containing protein [Streptomyces sp. NPDC059063]|uniref:VMAP-C domain-containing protein n=1 Tax=unclassified Streptomyces TaxID=2593676 RepID=UPI00367C12EB